MYLKNIDLRILSSASITTRLTIFYSLATILLLVIILVLVYTGMMTILYRSNNQLLIDEINAVKNILEKRPDNLTALEQEVREIPEVLSNSKYHYYVRILDHHKRSIIESIGMQNALQKAEFFNNTTMPNDEGIYWKTSGAKQYLMMQSSIKPRNMSETWLIQVALDITYQQSIIREYLKNILFILLLGSLCAIVLGYLIARKGMQSLHQLTTTAQEITATSLNRRIEPIFLPKELRALGMAFNQMLERIETSFLQLTQLSSDLAHELRTPINNLLGETEVVLSHNSSLEECKQILTSNLEELQRISQIIENLLFLAYAENPKINLEKKLLNVDKEISLICEYYQSLADEKNISISINGTAKINAHPIMFRRLVSNLLINALKYTSKDGWIKFYIQENSLHTVLIKISDNGIGIEAANLSKVFNRFFRTDTARSQHSGGVGLGLAIVKSIVDLHHGSIHIESTPGKGSTFFINLPK